MVGDRRLVGIDVGGTAVKLGVATPAGSILAESSIDVVDPTTDGVLDAMADEARKLGGAELDAVGVGLPGLLERTTGTVLSSPNLPWFDGVSVRAGLARRLELAPERVRIENDANVAALGELWVGGARGERHALVVTLGTGIGGGLILDGELFVGEGQAGEIGHVMIDPHGPPCGCGSRGCLETLASATAARRRALAAGLPREAPGDLIRLAAEARAAAGASRTLLEEIGRDLGCGLASAVCLLDIRSFVFGGGFAGALDVLEGGIRAGLREWAWGERVSDVRLVPASLGPSAGWIGAARLIR